MNYYIGDIHFGHANVLKFDGRPFATVDEMDAVIIAQWNAVVTDKDDVYILGDFCYRSAKDPMWYLSQLKGRKHLIIGNHDNALLKNERAMKEFVSVDKMTYVKDGSYTITMCHFPIAEWNRYFSGSWHIYGHIHNSKNRCFEFLKNEDRALNAGCMINHYTPVTIKQLIENNIAFKTEQEETAKTEDLKGLEDSEDMDYADWAYEDLLKVKDEDLHWAFAEYFKTGLIYHYYVNGIRDHVHTFDAVMRSAAENPCTFEIREPDYQEYSEQEQKYLEAIVERGRRVCM